jgi:hypothetical protein
MKFDDIANLYVESVAGSPESSHTMGMKNKKDTISDSSAEAAGAELSPEQWDLVRGHGGEMNEVVGKLWALLATLDKKDNSWMIDWVNKHVANHGYAKHFKEYGDELIEIGNRLNEVFGK